jgi:AcrR family transcriptional regulator
VVEFARKGFAEANINHISEAAGYSKGTIYHYFPSKQALMLALIAQTGGYHVESIASRVQDVTDPQQRLVRFYEAGFGFVEEHPVHARFLITALYTPERELQLAMYHAYQPMFRLVAQEIVLPGIQQGIFREIDGLEAANLLMTLYLGTSSNVDPHGKPFMDPHTVADFALHALQQDKPRVDRDQTREGTP